VQKVNDGCRKEILALDGALMYPGHRCTLKEILVFQTGLMNSECLFD